MKKISCETWQSWEIIASLPRFGRCPVGARPEAALAEHGLGEVGAAVQGVPPERVDVPLLDGAAELGGQAGVRGERGRAAALDRVQALGQGPGRKTLCNLRKGQKRRSAFFSMSHHM